MADTKISAFSDGTPLVATDKMVLARGGANYHYDPADILNYVAANAGADFIDTITEIAAALKTGSDAKLVTGTAGSTDALAKWNADGDLVGAANADIKGTHAIMVAVGDETTALTTGTAKVTFRMPYAFTLTGIRASCTTAPVHTTTGLVVDVNDGGTSIMTTNKLAFDSTEKTTTTASTAPTLTDTSLADDAEITIDIDSVGDGTAGAGLKVSLIGYRT